ncbi:MAG: hypothetical protein AB4050_01490 [Synechococcus sp.]
MCSSLVAIAAIAMGRPAIGFPALGTSTSRFVTQVTSNLQQHSTLRAQASPPAQPDTAPNASEPAIQGDPEREIEFTSPTFSIGVQGEGVQEEEIQGEGSQGNGGLGTSTQGETAQEPLEAGSQRDAGLSNEAANEALAAQHDWVEFSVEDSDEAIARYGCDDLYCINALREQRGLPPLQLVWDAQNSNTSPQ